MAGTLFVCATPIGNLADVSARLADTLRGVDLIAAEDTRSAQILLRAIEVKRPVISLEKFNEGRRTDGLISRLGRGENIALISEAGTPAISDPGAYLVRAAHVAGIAVVPLPGASALTTFLSMSGLVGPHFFFGGFFPRKNSDRAQLLQQFSGTILVFFESPQRILDALAWLHDSWRLNQFVVAKELTKVHEKYWTNYAQLKADIAADETLHRGEWIFGFSLEPQQDHSAGESAKFEALKAAKLNLKQALTVGKLLGLPRNQIYQKFHD